MSQMPSYSVNPRSSADFSAHATNNSTNILGGTGQSSTDLARILQFAQGADANGGFTEQILGSPNVGGITRFNSMPALLLGFGALILVAIVLWKK